MSKPWVLTRLGEMLRPVSRSERVEPTSQYRLLGIRLDGAGPFLRETIAGSQSAATTLYKVKAGDFIYSRLFACRGAFGVIGPDLDGCFVSGEFPTFSPVTDKVDANFLRLWFRLPEIIRRVDADCTGSTPLTRNRFKERFFVALDVPLPPLAEQRRIVAKLDALAAKIQEAHALRQEAGKETTALPEGRLRAVVHELVRHVGTRRLEALLVDAGYGTSVKCHYERQAGAVPVLRIPNVASERVALDDLKFGALDQSEMQRVEATEGDILVVRTNGSADLVGRCAVIPRLPERMAFASYLIGLRCDRGVIAPEFLQLMLKHLRTEGRLFDFARTTAGQYNVSLGRLRAADIPVPDLAEQRRIVTYIDSLQAKVDALKALQAQTAAELDALLPSILDRAFKGEL